MTPLDSAAILNAMTSLLSSDSTDYSPTIDQLFPTLLGNSALFPAQNFPIFTNSVLPPMQSLLNTNLMNFNPPLLGTEEMNNYLSNLLMLDMLYGNTIKDNDAAQPKNNIIEEFPNKGSPLLYRTLSPQSPATSTTVDNNMPPSSAFEKPVEHYSAPNTCTACCYTISDQAMAYVERRPYHINCVRCACCDANLGFDESCYMKDGIVLCRQDYMKKYQKMCPKCNSPIKRNDSVMKVRDAIFHVGCFVCNVCEKRLQKGDLFTMSAANHLFCHAHYSIVCNTVLKDDVQTSERQNNRELSEEPEDCRDDDDSQSGSRSKRMRTSFKHHQLRTMKHYFSLNHNPDAKDLKQLAQKTGLSKRVLQVWFQNARAKYRRSKQGKDGCTLSPVISHASNFDSSQHISSSSNNSSEYNLSNASPPESAPDTKFYDNSQTLCVL